MERGRWLRMTTPMSKLRYYDKAAPKKQSGTIGRAIYTEFLRTGRIDRRAEDWNQQERRYLTHNEVAARTGRRLEAAGETTCARLNSFHKAIRFPKIIFHRTLADSPHLGYCHVTAARTRFPGSAGDITWSFYIANFFADIGDADEQFFRRVSLSYSRMYFAVATEATEAGADLTINRRFRPNGVLFRTHEPKDALKNVLLLGARNEELRAIVKAL